MKLSRKTRYLSVALKNTDSKGSFSRTFWRSCVSAQIEPLTTGPTSQRGARFPAQSENLEQVNVEC
jgi:hypothetical protein